MSVILGSRSFTAEDIIHFAELSGDWNPIHVDRIAARRLLAGDIVVHGMQSLLWALEAHFANSGQIPGRITALFPTPLRPGEHLEVVRTFVDVTTSRLAIQRGTSEVASIVLRGQGTAVSAKAPVGSMCRETPNARDFASLKDLSGKTLILAHPTMESTFPHCCKSVGELGVATIMALSKLVGMDCPGLDSLFTGLDLILEPDLPNNCLDWKVVRHSRPIAPIRMKVVGGGIRAKVDAFMRNGPVEQPSMHEIAGVISQNSFKHQRALIVGGSRGLGELVAKIITAGGGEAIITYLSGAHDAARVVAEINDWGGHAKSIRVDVLNLGPSTIELKELDAPTHLYYFATPSIIAQKDLEFDEDLYKSYAKVYIDAFQRLIAIFLQNNHQKLTVFYPSSIFVDEKPKSFREYTKAKEMGEMLCASLNEKYENINIMVSRLHRMKTDQTSSLLPVATKPAMQEMLRVMEEMSISRKKAGNEN